MLTNAPRFSAYVASKAALEAWIRCAASEFADVGIKFTTINMPLVRTPMIAPTKVYRNVPALSPDEAAELVVRAIVYKPARIATEVGMLGLGMQLAAPHIAQIIMNTAFRLSADADAGGADRRGGTASNARDAAPAARRTPLMAPPAQQQEPLAAVDAAWLRMDRPTNLMMICGMMMLDGRVDLTAAREVIRTRMLCFHRFRQRVAGAAAPCRTGKRTLISTWIGMCAGSRCRPGAPRWRNSSAT